MVTLVSSVKIQLLNRFDINHVRQLHEKYFSEFDFPDFFGRILKAFKVVDNNGEIILAGAVRPIAETILVTDLSKNRIEIGRALVEAQRFSMYTCGQFNIDELHAFVKNEQYARHLERHGFSERSKAYSIRVL